MESYDKPAAPGTQSQATPPSLLAETQAALRELTCYVTFHIGDRLDGSDGLTQVLTRAHQVLNEAVAHDDTPLRSPWLRNL